MPRFTSLIIAASLAAAAGACAPVVATQGFQAVDVKPQDIESGVDTRETVLTKLGTPSTTSTFESENVWYYLTQTTQRYTYNKPQVSQRTVTDDGRQIAMERRETPTRGRQLTILEQLLGNVGRGQLPRTEDDVPGQRRPD